MGVAMLTRLQKFLPVPSHRALRVFSICLFAFQSVPMTLGTVMPLVLLATVMLAGGVLLTPYSLAFGCALVFGAFLPAFLVGFWIQLRAAVLVSTDNDFDWDRLLLPSRAWMAKTVPLACVLMAGFALTLPVGKMLLGQTTIAMVVWPMLSATVLLVIFLTMTGLSSVAAAQDIDADMSGHTFTGGMALGLNLAICLVLFLAVSIVLTPIIVGLTSLLGIPDIFATTLLLATLVALIWTASSIAMALLLEEQLWHTDYYN